MNIATESDSVLVILIDRELAAKKNDINQVVDLPDVGEYCMGSQSLTCAPFPP